MKWIGQHIYDLISRFRDDVYLEDISSGTIASGGNLGLDSNNKIVKDSGVGVTDLHGAGVDGSANQLLTDDGDGTVTSESTLTYASPDLTIAANDAKLTLITTSDGLYDTPGIDFKYIPAGGGGTDHPTFLGQIDWYGQSDAGTTRNFARQYVKARQDNNSAECGHWNLTVMSQGTLRNVMNAEGSTGGDWVNVNLGYSTLSTTTVAGILEVDGGAINAASGSSGKPLVTLKQQNSTKTTSSEIKFLKDAADVEDDEQLGKISFYGDNDAGTPEVIQYGAIIGTVADMTDGQEAGDLLFQVAEYDGTLTTGLKLDGDTNADGEIDVTIGAGAASVTTIAGTLTMGSTAAMTNAGLLSVAAQTNITSVGNTLSIGNSTSDNAQLNIQNQTTDAEGGVLVFKKTKGLIGGILQTPNDDDEIGRTSYTYSDDASITEYDYARTVVTATDVSNGSESGKYQILASGQGSLRNVISGEGGSTSAEIDVTIANGSESVTTIAGSLTVTNDLTVNGGNATINGGDTTDAILKLATNTASASDDVIIELVTDEDGTPRQARIGVDHSDNTLKLVHGSGFSGGTNGICVDSSGNVGLGTASPEAHLHLESAGDTAIIVRADVGNSGEDDNPLIHLQQDFVAAGSSGVMVDGKLGIVGTAGQIMSSSIANSTYITAQGGGSSPNVSMQFGTGGNNGQDTDHAAVLPTARMTIRHDGKIGIGTNDPDSLLEIFGTSTQLKLSNNASDYASFAVGTHGNLTITTVDAAATAAHIELAADGNIVLDAAGDIALESGGSDVTSDARNFTISNGESSSPSLKLQSIKDDTSAAFFTFDKNRFLGAEEAGTADGDTLGTIQWTGTNDAMQLITYANIISTIAEVTDTDEAGKLTMQVAASNGTASTMQDGIVIEGTGTTRQANVTIGNAVDCTTTIAGNLMVTTGIELGHASDTTIARSAAGTVTIEGEQIATNIYSKKVVISQAEMNALALAPKELVAAPGSNKFIDVLSFNLIVDRASTNTVSAYLSCSYNGDSSLAGALFLRKSFMLNKTTDTYYPVMRYTTDAGNTDPINKSVTAQLQSAITSNCTTSTTVLITYSIIDAS